MPINFRELERRAGLFNKRYGVNFNIEEFVNSTNALNDDMIDLSRDKETVNSFYRVAFRPLVKKALENCVNNEIDAIDPWQMLREFEANVMSFYRSECERTKEGVAPDVDAGWTQSDYLGRIEQDIRGMNPSKQVYISDKYMKNQLRLRDIRKYVEETGNSLSPSRVSTVLLYARTVKEAMGKRTGVWKFFHPFKSRAEERDLSMLKTFLKDYGVNEDLSIDPENKPYLKEVKAELDKEPIADVKEMIARSRENPIPTKANEEYVYEKPSVKIEDISAEARIDPDSKKPLEMHDFLKVGYRPDPKNIDKEYELSTRLYDAVIRNKQPISSDPKVNEAASIILMKNYMRVRPIKARADADGGALENATNLLKACEPAFSADDNAFINQFPDYVPPEIPMDILKEKVEIIEDNNKSVELSKRIEEVQTGPIERSIT